MNRGAASLPRVVTLSLLATLLPLPALARPARPADAPVLDEPRPALPDATPEYASAEQAGIKIVYHPLARDRAHALLARAQSMRAELTGELGQEVLSSVEIRVAAAPAQMAGLSPGPVPAAATVVAFRDYRLVVMSVGAAGSLEPTDLDERLRHALGHLALDEAVGRHDLPRWFHEGYAIHASGEDAVQRAETLILGSVRDRILRLEDVEAQLPEGPSRGSLAAAEAADFVRFTTERAQRPRFRALIERLRAGETFETALGAAWGVEEGRLELGWRKDLTRRYSFVPVLVALSLVWIVIAAVVMVRRRRALHARRAEELSRGAHITLPPVRSSRRERRPPRDVILEELAESLPPDHEIPKVEHDGRWHTLH